MGVGVGSGPDVSDRRDSSDRPAGLYYRPDKKIQDASSKQAPKPDHSRRNPFSSAIIDMRLATGYIP
jgi:hypothetical protein